MYTRRSFALTLLASGMLAAQEAPATVQVTGAVKQPLTLSADDLAKMPRASVRTTSNGMETVYEGVWLHEVLKKAGVPQGSELRGKALTSYVLAQAQDGYQVVFSLGELDPAFIDNEILLADTANGTALFGAQGRFRLVVPKDKPGARSIRMLTKLEVVQLRK
jgi:DMSO/TMAO reductase YedYZ molybdopterin-dependent catalytic subunit